MADTTTDAPTTLALISNNLQRLLRDGARPAKLAAYPELLALQAVRGDELREPVFALETLLLEAVDRLGDGPEGVAVRLLFGLHPDTRGRLLKDRRRLAAEQFDVLPSTFRRYYEDELIADLAAEIWRDEYVARQPVCRARMRRRAPSTECQGGSR